MTFSRPAAVATILVSMVAPSMAPGALPQGRSRARPAARSITTASGRAASAAPVTPYFEKGPLQARVSYNRWSKYFYRYGRVQSQDYTDAYAQLNAQLSYQLNRHVQVTANASSLLDETYYQYSSDPRFPTSVYKSGRVFALTATF